MVRERALYAEVYCVGDNLFSTGLIIQSFAHLTAYRIVGKFHRVQSGITLGVQLHFVLEAALVYICQSLVNESAQLKRREVLKCVARRQGRHTPRPILLHQLLGLRDYIRLPMPDL